MRTVVSLFSGIGGFEVGFRSAGYSVAALCDNDPAATAVLAAQFPDVPLLGDIRKITDLPKSDVITAGFPCQNLSMVGDKSGIRGSKSSVVGELFRLLQLNKPAWVVIENVRFMLWLRHGEAMEELIRGFEELGYDWAYRVLDSRWFGSPQRRKRVYFVASNVFKPEEVLLSDDGGFYEEPFKAQPEVPIGFYWTEGRSGLGTTFDALPTLKAGSGWGIPSPPAALFPNGEVRIPTIQDAETIQGFPKNWTIAADSEIRRSRWKLVGNSVTVGVAEWLATRLIQPMPLQSKVSAHTFLPGERWPAAAYGTGGNRIRVDVSDRPKEGQLGRLSNSDCSEWLPLSKRATDGFILRTQESRLNISKGFLSSLTKYSRRQSRVKQSVK